MAFFEPPRSRTAAQAQSNSRSSAPVGPPRQVIPAVVPLELVIYRSNEAVVVVNRADVYTVGCSFWLTVAARLQAGDEARAHRFSEAIFADTEELSQLTSLNDALVRFGVTYPDGARATTLDPPPDQPLTALAETVTPSLVHYEHNARRGDLLWEGEHELWLSPLPPAEPFELVIEWPALDIPLTHASIDGSALTQASARARSVWT